MKRKIFSAVLALVMLLTLAPVAFAAEDEDEPVVILPDGTKVVGIPTIDAPKERSAEQTVYTIDSEAELKRLLTEENQNIWLLDNIFEITANLDLTDLYETQNVPSFDGLIRFLKGTIRGVELPGGGYPTITGIPSGRALVRAPIGGSIENLNFDYGTYSPYITLLAGTITGDTNVYTLTLKNIIVNGNNAVPTTAPSNYAPFVYTCPAGGLIMENCTNNINMIGSAYSSIFFGYYPAYYRTYEQMTIKFINCVNNGNLTTNRAGMFFGNSTGLDNYIDRINLTIEGCVNNGTIFGYDSAYYLCAAAANEGEFSDGTTSAKIESVLVNGSESPYASDYSTIQKVDGDPEDIGKVTPLSGFEAHWKSDNTITFTPATDRNDVTYRVRVGSYLYDWDVENNKLFGTFLYTVDQTFTPEQVSGGQEITSALMVYGMANSGYGIGSGNVGGYATRTGAEGRCYVITNPEGSAYMYYAALDDEGQPLDNGSTPPDVVIVTAYGENNRILQSYWITQPEAQG